MAVTAGGKPRVSAASSTATSGSSTGEDTPALVVSPVVMTATGVTSEPVPAVVGTSTRGSLPPVTWPTPYSSGSVCVTAQQHGHHLGHIHGTAAADGDDTVDTRRCAPAATAASTVASGGSSRTWSNTSGGRPALARAPPATGCTRPIAIKPGIGHQQGPRHTQLPALARPAPARCPRR